MKPLKDLPLPDVASYNCPPAINDDLVRASMSLIASDRSERGRAVKVRDVEGPLTQDVIAFSTSTKRYGYPVKEEPPKAGEA